MDDPSKYESADDDAARSRDEITGTPRWVKVFAAIAIVVVLLFALMMFGRGHGPGRHFRSADTTNHAPPNGHR
jgi:hypothetical protein